MYLDKLVPNTAVFPVFNLPGSSSKSGLNFDLCKGGKSLRKYSASESHSCSNTRRDDQATFWSEYEEEWYFRVVQRQEHVKEIYARSIISEMNSLGWISGEL